jgi:hypothetical protein
MMLRADCGAVKAVLIAALALTACAPRAPQATGDPDNPLEEAARDRGLVDEQENASLVGVFERQHELGQDGLCAVERGGDTRFALTASYGPGVRCTGTGRIERKDGSWLLRFAGDSGCAIEVHEEGGNLLFAGSVPRACDDLCPSRASLSGLSMPRISWSGDDARRFRLIDRKGDVATPCAD